MKRSTKVCWVAFVVSTLILAAVAGLTIYFTIFRRRGALGTTQSEDEAVTGPPIPKAGEKSGLFDHRSHSVPGGDYYFVDYEGVGYVTEQLDGSRSHTHFFDEGPPVVIGNITHMVWFDKNSRKVLGYGVRPRITFTLGTHNVGLTVRDNTRDTHTDFTKVFVRSPIFDGVYCYFYHASDVDDDISKGVRPTYAMKASTLSFSHSNFPSNFRKSAFTMRCTFVSQLSTTTTFNIQHKGNVRLLIDQNPVPLTTKSTGVSTGVHNIDDSDDNEQTRYSHLELILNCAAGAKCSATLTSGVSKIQHDVSRIVPIIYSLDPATSTKDGGGKVKISGIGLKNGVEVMFGDVQVEPKIIAEDGLSMEVVVPKVSTEKQVEIIASNKNGASPSISFQYSNNGKLPIKFTETSINVPGAHLITGIKYGPDHRFYLSAVYGVVFSVELNSNLKIQGEVCKSPSIGENRGILGLAFNYALPKVRLYVSTSVLEWKTKSLLSGPFAWANGQVYAMEKNVNGKCLDVVGEPIITGLPVSNHDHGVNGMVFSDDGKLHIQVGGFTNAGHNEEQSRLGGIDENPLSGASLVADIYKSGFDGKVTYDVKDPGQARQIGGLDVQVFSPGWRNSFGINVHSNGFLYATDNGASKGFGEMSVSCTKHTALPGNQNLKDKLSKVMKGKYAGHPNRNRGRDDPGQCKFIGVHGSGSKYQKPVATFESSTNGVVEYTANTFGGQLKGDLMLSKFATDQSPGKIFRVQLNENGDSEQDPDVLWEASGVSIEMSPWGDVLSPRVYKKPIVAIRPVNSVSQGGVILTSVMPPRGSFNGGTNVRVTGINFGDSPVAYFDSKPCTNVKVNSDSEFFCKTPPGQPGKAVQVIVKSNTGNSKPTQGADFKYMRV